MAGKKPTASKDADNSEVQGEGDYISARKFQKHERDFVQDEDLVERKAREAADALDGPEGEDLEEAEEVSREGNSL